MNDDLSAFIPLHIAQRILKTGNEVSLIDVGAYCADCPVEEVARQIMSGGCVNFPPPILKTTVDNGINIDISNLNMKLLG